MRMVLLLVLALMAQRLFAGAFDDVQVSGHCNNRNTHTIENGDSFSVIFDDLGADMPQGVQGDGKLVRKVCNFRIRMTHPRNQYLSGLRQVFSGGVIKSKGASGILELAYILGGKMAAPSLVWKEGVGISPESPQSLFSRVIDDSLAQPRGCSGQTHYLVHIGFTAARRNLQDFFVGGLDSYDAEFVHRLDLVPTWKPCRR